MKQYLIYVTPLLLAALACPAAMANAQDTPRVTPMTPDVVASYEQTLPSADFVRREVMVPMRDGTKLYTIIMMRKGTRNGPSSCRAAPTTPAAPRTVSPASGWSTTST